MDPKAPEKKAQLLSALERGMVMIHLDARRPGVVVPQSLRGEWHLRLNLSYRFDPPDLSVSEWGVRCTLSFGGVRSTVAVPWPALFAITSHVSSADFWMDEDALPEELIALGLKGQAPAPVAVEPADRPKAILREVVCPEPDGPGAPAPEESANEAPKPRQRSHLRVVK